MRSAYQACNQESGTFPSLPKVIKPKIKTNFVCAHRLRQ
jgi:hypothetical protein